MLGRKLLTQTNSGNTESAYQGPRRPYGTAGGWKMPSHRKTKRKKDGQRGSANGNHDALETTARTTREYQEKVRPLPKKRGQTENRRPTTAKTRKTPTRDPHTASHKIPKDETDDPVRDPLMDLLEELQQENERAMEILQEKFLSQIGLTTRMMTAKCVLEATLTGIHRRGRERYEQRSKITKRLQGKITSRD